MAQNGIKKEIYQAYYPDMNAIISYDLYNNVKILNNLEQFKTQNIYLNNGSELLIYISKMTLFSHL